MKMSSYCYIEESLNQYTFLNPLVPLNLLFSLSLYSMLSALEISSYSLSSSDLFFAIWVLDFSDTDTLPR